MRKKKHYHSITFSMSSLSQAKVKRLSCKLRKELESFENFDEKIKVFITEKRGIAASMHCPRCESMVYDYRHKCPECGLMV